MLSKRLLLSLMVVLPLAAAAPQFPAAGGEDLPVTPMPLPAAGDNSWINDPNNPGLPISDDGVDDPFGDGVDGGVDDGFDPDAVDDSFDNPPIIGGAAGATTTVVAKPTQAAVCNGAPMPSATGAADDCAQAAKDIIINISDKNLADTQEFRMNRDLALNNNFPHGQILPHMHGYQTCVITLKLNDQTNVTNAVPMEIMAQALDTWTACGATNRQPRGTINFNVWIISYEVFSKNVFNYVKDFEGVMNDHSGDQGKVNAAWTTYNNAVGPDRFN